MDSFGLTLVCIAIVGMFLQSASCMLSDKRPLSVGFLNFFLGALTIVLALLICSGALVIAPEFGAVMVQGRGAEWSLRLALVATAALPTLCWYRIRELNKWPTRLWTRLIPGIVIGVWAATRLIELNPDDFEALRVSIYDVWWPPLVIWLTLCLAETMLALAKVESEVDGTAFAAAIVAPLARFALMHQELSDPQSRPWWQDAEGFALVFCLLSIFRAYFLVHIHKRIWKVVVWVVFIVVWLAGAGLFDLANDTVKIVVDCLPILVLIAAIALALIGRMLHSNPPLKPQTDEDDPAEPASSAISILANASSRAVGVIRFAVRGFSIHRATGAFFSIAILVIPICIMDIFSIGALDRNVDILILVVFWLGFSARLARGVFNTLPRLFVNGVLQLPPFGGPALNGVWEFFKSAFVRTRDSASAAIKTFAKVFSTSNAWVLTIRTILATVVALLLLVAVGEMLNYGKLVVEPFTWVGNGDDEKDKDKVAERVSDGVVNALGDMRRELLPVLLLSSPTGARSSALRVEPAVLDNDAMQTAVAKSTDLKITENVSIPLPLITGPVQKLIRWLFDIRAVSGSIHISSDKKMYVLLINSANGGTWRVVEDIPATDSGSKPAGTADAKSDAASDKEKQEKPTQDKLKKTDIKQVETKQDTKKATTNPSAIEQVEAPPPPAFDPACEEEKQGDDLNDLIDRAAFNIASGDPSFIAMGLTTNWKAYSDFRAGLHKWNCYQSYKHVSDLNDSIQLFRQSAEEDPSFAPAEYRLGIALQTVGNLDSAVRAFELATDANPDLIQAKTAEAQTLDSVSNLNSTFSWPAVAALPPENDRSNEARRLWAEIVSLPTTPTNLPDKRAAYYGLCTSRFFVDDANDPVPNKFYLRYFNCSRAQAMFFRLPLLNNEKEQKQLEANILYGLGDVLNFHDYKKLVFTQVDDKTLHIQLEDGRSTGMTIKRDDSANSFTIKRDDSPTPRQLPNGGDAFWPGFCSQESVDYSDPTHLDSKVRLIRGSSLTPHALRYYRASLALVPDNYYVQCSEATAQTFITQDDPVMAQRAMNHLAILADSHLQLANAFSSLAQIYDGSYRYQIGNGNRSDFNPEYAPFFYRQALVEYEHTINISPTNVDALTGYASTVWQWSLDTTIPGIAMAGPDPYEKSEAEADAREAVRASNFQLDREMWIWSENTLGEVSLLEGRYDEAIAEITKAEKAEYKLEGANEIHWNLAQALLCASMTPSSKREKQYQDAVHEFNSIWTDEYGHELLPFSNIADPLDAQAGLQRCMYWPPPPLPLPPPPPVRASRGK